jgi:2-polyprenyl-3-methyl-5-hydroxy-6-metoxy-1,4-benzoquinol methylase
MVKDFSADSGERISAITEDRIITDHLARYHYASRRVIDFFNGGSSLFGADLFCGSGYGTNILARDTGAVIIGIDGSEEAISRANNAFPRSNSFFSHKFFPFDLPPEVFNFVCSFESIEHILDYKVFATTIASAIKIGGLLMVSCPNAEKINLDINPYHWHYKHLTPLEFEKLFTSLGMELIEKSSTLCVIPNEYQKVIAVNHFAIPRNEVKDDLSGDTMLFIFKKVV